VKQAYIGLIQKLIEIPGAEKIESAIANCDEGGIWQGCVQKQTFSIDDKCMVFLQDSILPEIPEFEHMRKHHFRVRMCRFLKTPSEVLIAPITPLSNMETFPVGEEISDVIGVTKYEKPISISMAGECKGNFPSFIPKTDEINFQTIPDLIKDYVNHPCWITLKYDGTSATFYHRDGEIGVCSRNLEKKLTSQDVYNRIDKKYRITQQLQESNLNCAIQGEIYGPGIQKNPLGVQALSFACFDIYDIDKRKYLLPFEREKLLDQFGIPSVKLIDQTTWIDTDFEQIRTLADQKYENGKSAEGVVVRVYDDSDGELSNGISFKIINLAYKN
jgi:RNA ligase (TIGR02306 family)